MTKIFWQKHSKKIAIGSSFLLHLLFLIFLFLSNKSIDDKPQTVVLNLSLIAKEDLDRDLSKRQKQSNESVNSNHHDDEKLLSEKSDGNIHHHGESGGKGAVILQNPLPQIPDDLRDEAFESEAIARFYITVSGDVSEVELIKPCANPKLNYLLLKALRKWKFAAKSSSSTQDIKVKFRVE